ncbi:MAG: poly(ADP-ribose) polymerase family protein [Candidatus Acidiferrales bacterium]
MPTAAAPTTTSGSEDPYAAYGGASVTSPAAPVSSAPPPATSAQADPYAAYGGKTASAPTAQKDPYAAYGGKSTAPTAKEDTPSILTRLKNIVEGPGTFSGTSEAGDTWSNLFHHPVNYAENAFGYAKDLATKPVVAPQNAETEEFKKAHPIITGAAEFAGGLTTPTNVALAGVVGPALKGTVAGAEALGLSKVGLKLIPKLVEAGFGVQQLHQAAAEIPEIEDAINRGDYSDAKRLMTTAVLSGSLGLVAGFHGGKGVHDTISDAISTPGAISEHPVSAAMQEPAYSDAVHQFQHENQLVSAQREDAAAEGKKVFKDEKRASAASNYHEAGANTDLLAQREAATREGAGRVVPTNSAPPGDTGTVVYHGSAADNVNSITDLDAAYSKDKATAGPGIYLSRDPSVASSYVQNQPGARILTGMMSPAAKLLDVNSPLPESVLKAADLPKGSTYYSALAKIRDGMNFENEDKTVSDGINQIYDLQKSLGDAGFHGVKNLYAGRDARMIFPDYALPENQKFHDLVQAQLPRAAAPVVAPNQGETVPFGEERTPSNRDLLKRNLALKPLTAEDKAAAAKRISGLAEGYKTAQDLTPKEQDYIFRAKNAMEDRKAELQAAEMLPPGMVRENYIHHPEWADIADEEDENSASPRESFGGNRDFLKKRVFPTFHHGEAAGNTASTKSFPALYADYLGDSGHALAQKHLVDNLENGHAANGMPLTAKGGFVASSGTVVPEGPQDVRLSNDDVKQFTKQGTLADLVKSGDVYVRPDNETGQPAYFASMHDYVKTPLKSTQFVRMPLSEAIKNQLGVTDKPELLPSDELRAANDAKIKDLQKQQALYQGSDGKLYETTPRRVRVPVYARPEIAPHLNNVLEEYKPGKVMKSILKIGSQQKQSLFSLAGFHAFTELGRSAQTLFPTNFEDVKALPSTFKSLFQPIDYNNLSPVQERAMRSGIVVGEVRPRASSYAEEGLTAGEDASLLNKAYDKITKPISEGLKKVGVPSEIADNLNLNRLFAKSLFSSHGIISHLKFASFESLDPEVTELVRKQHPDWSEAQISKAGGRETAKQINNAFGSLNYVVLGRSMQSQAFARSLLLAPDFLESSGRNLLDLAGPYGGKLLKAFIYFNLMRYTTARVMNLLVHHREGDTFTEDLEATHPESGLGVLSPDGKTIWDWRSQLGDFIHFAKAPLDFGLNRIAPLGKMSYSLLFGKDQYGRQLPPLQRYVGAPLKSFVPLPVQGGAAYLENKLHLPTVFGNSGVAEPTGSQTILKSAGAENYPSLTPAEQLAMQIASNKLEGQPIRTGPDLISHQLGLRIEDKLRDAYQSKDPASIEKAIADLQSLRAQKIITVKSYGQILKAARQTRLAGVFTHLSPEDALRVWDIATATEKRDLSREMNQKFVKWKEKIRAEGGNINNLSNDDQQTLNAFRKASVDSAALREQPVIPNTNPSDPFYYQEVQRLAGKLLGAVRAQL